MIYFNYIFIDSRYYYQTYYYARQNLVFLNFCQINYLSFLLCLEVIIGFHLLPYIICNSIVIIITFIAITFIFITIIIAIVIFIITTIRLVLEFIRSITTYNFIISWQEIWLQYEQGYSQNVILQESVLFNQVNTLFHYFILVQIIQVIMVCQLFLLDNLLCYYYFINFHYYYYYYQVYDHSNWRFLIVFQDLHYYFNILYYYLNVKIYHLNPLIFFVFFFKYLDTKRLCIL